MPTNCKEGQTEAAVELISSGLQTARSTGWARIRSEFAPESIAAAVRRIGQPLRSRDRTVGVEQLMPRHEHEARTPSLSAQHGMGVFPFHSDAAHWISPPRWVIMWCEADQTRRATNLRYWAPIVERMSERTTATFLVRNGRRSFFVDVRDEARFDGGCMLPQNRAARTMAELSVSAKEEDVIPIVWEAGTVLLLDNRRMLHARSTCLSSDGDHKRTLWRALLEEVSI